MIEKLLSRTLLAVALILPAAAFAGAASAWTPPGAVTLVAADKGYGEKNPVATVDEARAAVEHYLAEKGSRVPSLKPGAIEEKDLYFEVEVLDQSGKPVDRLIVDKRTGRIRSIL